MSEMINEIKEYERLRRDYYQSSKLTTEFNVERFRELDSKFAPMDIIGMILDAYDKVEAERDKLNEECLRMANERLDAEWPLLKERDQLRAEVERLKEDLSFTVKRRIAPGKYELAIAALEVIESNGAGQPHGWTPAKHARIALGQIGKENRCIFGPDTGEDGEIWQE